MVLIVYGYCFFDVKDVQLVEIDMVGEFYNLGVFYCLWQWGGGIDFWCFDYFDEVN